MLKSKTHFEQIPVELVKKIAAENASDKNDGNNGAVRTIGSSKLKPHRLRSLRKNEKSI